MTLDERALKLRSLLKGLCSVDLKDLKEVVRIVKEIIEIEPFRIVNQLILVLLNTSNIIKEASDLEELLDTLDDIYDDEEFEEDV